MMLETTGLSKNFGGLRAVSDVSISVTPRTIHSVIGPNGAGKTTLFNLVTGAIESDAGTVRFEGHDVSGWSPNRLARAGLVRTFQRTSIFRRLTVLENIGLAIRSREGKNYSVTLSRQDAARFLEEAEALGVPMPVGSAARNMLSITNALYGPESDFTCMAKIVEQWAGVEIA